ncbi:MAG: 50S ribosomal protein L11 methyltransferase [Novosphingobium sp.]
MPDDSSKDLFAHPAQVLRLGKGLVDSGKADQALVLARQARAARPDDPLIERIARTILYYKVPGYHHAMLRDHPRNAAYRRAIEAVAAGRVVLDIGSGSGLLAMLAARAGAAHVHTCEMLPQLAATAREIIAANGLADRITVHACHSGKLDRVRDLGGGADLIVNEILSHDVVGERILPSMAHARAELAAPDALVLPERASVRVALAQQACSYEPLDEVEGFDLSLFNRHVKGQELRRPNRPDCTLRSAPADLLTFDFTGQIALEGRAAAALLADGGTINCIAQWIHVDLVPGVTYENPPGANPEGHWRTGLYAVDPSCTPAAGTPVTVHGWHDHESIQIWTDPA